MLEADVPFKVVEGGAQLETVEVGKILHSGVEVVETTITLLTLEMAPELIWS